MDARAGMVAEFEQEAAATRRLLALAPEEKFAWKPHPKSMSLLNLIGHLAELPSWGPMTIGVDQLEFSTKDFKPRTYTSLAEILELFDRNTADYLKTLKGTSDERLDGHWSLKADGKQVIDAPRWQVLRGFVHSHMIHHRGQLTVYLRLLDVPLPSTYGPTADNPQMGG